MGLAWGFPALFWSHTSSVPVSPSTYLRIALGVLVAVTGADCAHVDASACSTDAANPNCAASVTHKHGGH